MRRFVGAAVAGFLLLAGGRAGAVTNTLDGAEVEGEKTPTGYTMEISAWSGGGPVPLGSNPLEHCVIIGGLEGNMAIDYGGGRGIDLGITHPDMASSESLWVFMSCRDRILGSTDWSVWEEGETPPDVVVEAMIDAARSSIEVPALTPESAPDGLDTPFLTQLPVWLWVPAESWVPVSSTASLADLGLSVTATATPKSTSWLTGTEEDGEPKICAAGTPWEAGLDDDATDCSATFGDTTPPGTTIDLTVTTTYDIAFVCTPGLCAGADLDLPGFAVTVARPVTVTEARGVISR